MTLPDPHQPLNPDDVQDDAFEDEVLAPATPGAEALGSVQNTGETSEADG